MSVGVHTPLGKLWHLAESRTGARTYCGLPYSDGYDTIEVDMTQIPASEICQTCRSGRARRLERGST